MAALLLFMVGPREGALLHIPELGMREADRKAIVTHASAPTAEILAAAKPYDRSRTETNLAP